MFTANRKFLLKKVAFLGLVLLACFWWLPISLRMDLKEDEKGGKAVTEKLLQHVEDHHSLHFGAVEIPLPVILYKKGGGWSVFLSNCFHEGHEPVVYRGFKIEKGVVVAEDGAAVYDFSVTKNVVAMLLSVSMMLVLFVGLASYMRRRRGRPPKGLWVVPLFLVRFVRNDIARKAIGERHYVRFTPYLLTLFFYIFFNNVLGLLPEGANVTGNISITLTLAAFTFFIMVFNGSRAYWGHIFKPEGMPVIMYPLMIPIELLGMVMRPAILGGRLFANMFAGHLSLLGLLALIFVTKSGVVSFFVVPLSACMVIFKIFISFVQAYIFTLFSANFFGTAVQEHKHT